MIKANNLCFSKTAKPGIALHSSAGPADPGWTEERPPVSVARISHMWACAYTLQELREHPAYATEKYNDDMAWYAVWDEHARTQKQKRLQEMQT